MMLTRDDATVADGGPVLRVGGNSSQGFCKV